MKKYLLSLLFILSMVSCETETIKLQKIQDNVEETICKKKIKVLYHYCDI